MKKNNNNLSRRELLKNAALVGSGATLMPFGFARANPRRKNSEAIDAENSKPGTLEWQLQYTGFEWPDSLRAYPLNRGLRSLAIEGYASKTSVYPGENIDFKVSTEPAAKFVIDIYRMGYYGGKGGRHMVKLGAFKGKPQPLPRMTIERLRECDWETATSFTVPTDWPSGIYLAKLSREEDFGKQSYITFVVKEKRTSDILCQVSDLTWQAYNKWPGNNSLYDDGSPSVWYVGPGVRVSFDRPYAKYCQILDAPLSVGSGEFLLWEHPMVFWLEKQGYDVTYCSNLDLHLDSEILDRSKVFISIGHDEYWSRKMFNEAIKARDNGMSFAFLCGNSVYTEIEFYASSVTGAPCRSFSRKKRFDDSHELMGVSSYGVGHGDWVVKNSKNWIYEGTGFGENDKIPGLIGWEYHGPPLGDHTEPANGFSYWVSKPGGHTTGFYNKEVIENGKVRVEEGYTTDFWTKKGIEFIEKNKDKDQPFFLALTYNGPYGLSDLMLRPAKNRWAKYYENMHFQSFVADKMHPWQRSWKQFHNRQSAMERYASEVSGVDDGVGEILTTLKRYGLDSNTLVIFTGDQGWMGGQNGIWGMGDHTRPIGAHDLMMKIPLIFHHPGNIPSGRESDIIVSNYDFMPTLLNYLGISWENNNDLESPGRDFSPLLKGKKNFSWVNEMFYEMENTRAIRTDKWKYVARYPEGPYELYNVKIDPQERFNMYGQSNSQKKTAELSARLEAFFSEYADPQYDIWNGGESKVHRITSDSSNYTKNYFY